MTDIINDRPVDTKQQRVPPVADSQHRVGVRAALGVGVAIAGIVRGEQIARTAEKVNQPVDPRNHVEGGFHVSTKEEATEVRRRFDAGDLSASNWDRNPQLRERLKAYRPRVLTLDNIHAPRHWGAFDKVFAWTGSPIRPRELHPEEKKVLLIAGDTTYDDYTQDVQDATVDQKLDQIVKGYDDNWNGKFKREGSIAAGALLLGATLATMEVLHNRKVRSHPDKPASSRMSEPRPRGMQATTSRRKLLIGAAAAAGLIATQKIADLAGIGSAAEATQHSDPLKSNTYQRIATLLDGMPDDIWVDGRTALLIAKHEDGMKFLREQGEITEDAHGAVILGFGHSGKSELYLHDKEARDEAIRRYAEYVLDATMQVADERLGFSAEQRVAFQNDLLDTFSSLHVVSMTDPEEHPSGVPEWYVNHNVEVIHPRVPSPQVSQAVAGLRAQ